MFAGGPFAGAPFAGLPRLAAAGLDRSATASVAAGGSITFSNARQLIVNAPLAGGGSFALGLARQLVATARMAGGGALAAAATRGLVQTARIDGGGRIGLLTNVLTVNLFAVDLPAGRTMAAPAVQQIRIRPQGTIT